MDISIFSRGINIPTPPYEGAVEKQAPAAKAVVLLRQCAGVDADCTVEKGAKVKVGQKIATPKDNNGAALHAPISGEVVGFEDFAMTDGCKCKAVVIESDGQDTWDEHAIVEKDTLKRIGEAGIVTHGRNGVSLKELLEQVLAPRGFDSTTGQPLLRRLDNFVVRFCDVDPHLNSLVGATKDMGNNMDNLNAGIKALVKLTGASDVHFVLGKKQDAEAVVKYADAADYAVHKIDRSKYPYCADPFVVKKVSGKEPPVSFDKPSSSGTLVLDITTVLEVSRAIRLGMPVVDKIITIFGPRSLKVIKVRLGMRLSEVIQAAGYTDDYSKVILEGPLGGMAIHTLDFPVTKNLSGITLVPPSQLTTFENDPCISCGLCTAVCPTRLVPGMLSRFCEYEKWTDAENAHLFNCVECGSCAYVCPAGRSMVQLMVL